MSMDKNNEKRVSLSPDDNAGNIKLTNETGHVASKDIDSLAVAIVGGLYIMLILTAIFHYTSIPYHFLWVPTVIIIFILYIYIINAKLHISVVISGSLAALAGYFYSSDFDLVYFTSYFREDIWRLYFYGLIFFVFGCLYSYLLRNKSEAWQIIVTAFLLGFIVNNFVM